MGKALSAKDIVPLSSDLGFEYPKAGSNKSKMPKQPQLSSGAPTNEELQMLDAIVPVSGEVPIPPVGTEKERGKLHCTSSSSAYGAKNQLTKSVISTPCLTRPDSGSKCLKKKKILNDSSLSGCSSEETSGKNHTACSSGDLICQTPNSATVKGRREENGVSSVSSNANTGTEVRLKHVESTPRKPSLYSLCYSKPRSTPTKPDERSRSREMGNVSKSSKSNSITSFSEKIQVNGASQSSSRPHMSKDVRWEAINSVKKQHQSLGFRHFKLLKKLGGGDIGTIYLTELVGTDCLFAVKVMDNALLAGRRKMARALTEKEILSILDHPFLPTLYADFTADGFSCLVMDYCPGGDLHVLRQRQPTKSFTEQAARFYAAEVLLALEYLHMLGIVYRDLKPENIMVQEDGHIVLTDFDLSLRCTVDPTVLKSSSPIVDPQKKMSSHCSESSCMDPSCLGPSWPVSCFAPRFLSAAAESPVLKSDIASQVNLLPQLIVEPTNARSNSFVGTHEYLAPEIIRGEGHGSAVDWWTLGILLYELLYGTTPFKGSGNDDTLANVVSQCLKFPATPMVSSCCRDLIRSLLQKEPKNRLGFERGAAEIKQHPFFEGLNLALIRCVTPPELPELGNELLFTVPRKEESSLRLKELDSTEDDIVFEIF